MRNTQQGKSGRGAEQQDDDEALLSSLGVTAANPVDIERTLLAQVKQKAWESDIGLVDDDGDEGVAADGGEHEGDVQAGLRARLQSKLVALDREIDAVADGAQAFQASVGEAAEGSARNASLEADGDQVLGEEAKVNQGDPAMDGASLHRALANDRLKSLLRKRRQLKEQLKILKKKEQEDDELLRSLVGETNAIPDGKGKGKGKRKVDVVTASASKSGKKSVSFLEDEGFDAELDAASGLMETERDKLIRTGMLTPFDRVKGFERKVRSAPRSEVRPNREEDEDEHKAKQSIANLAATLAAIAKSRPTSKLLDASELPDLERPTREFRRLQTPLKKPQETEEGQPKVRKKVENRPKRPLPERKWRRRGDDENEEVDAEDESWSGDEDGQRKKRSRTSRLQDKSEIGENEEEGTSEENVTEGEDVVLDGGLKIPAQIYEKLFDYQKTGVKWMWELHCQKAGGIIGDEMGLGKTIQVIAFLAGLHNSEMYMPSIVICPVTLLRQWRREIRKWYPAFSVEIIHDSAIESPAKSSKKKKRRTRQGSDEDYEEETDESGEEKEKAVAVKKENRWDAVIHRVVQSTSGILITTYEQLRVVREKLLDINWGYAVLDEGHRIRNPDAETTLVCKQLQTVHRIIMTGAPIQNRLTELWSLFDFVFPGKLGVLPVFQAQFALPIAIGGYANATPLQVSTAYRCAVVLRDLIMPYLLRRMKSDVNAQLPKKTEHVLFCSLTDDQRAAYRAFLASSEVEQIFDGARNSLYGIDVLRKICNHPDLLEREHSSNHPDYGNPDRSGKLKVLAQVLDLWNNQGHRVLLFTQTQQMLDIIENYVISKGFVYRRMDGNTPVKHRMALIDEFNEGGNVFIFILTTRVGGLGTNLVGANRVVIFDPDWNPSTDMQARERAWRIGQTREVTIYRLITRGTIEEKVYHRQIYKHFLTNKILRDPQQRRFFKARDMRDLFTLQEDGAIKTETSTLFAEVGGDISLDEEYKLSDNGKDTGGMVPHATSIRGHNEVEEHHISEGKLIEATTSTQKGKTKAITEDGEPQEEESRVLKSLFEANGIHSAMDHDVILGMHESEKVNIDHEATRVAERAARALQQSRRLRSAESVAVPTWTGRSGTAGAPPGARQRFGSTTNSRLVSSSSSGGSQARPPLGAGGAGAVVARPVMGNLAGSSAGKTFSSADLLARVRARNVNISGATEAELPVESGSLNAASRAGNRHSGSGRSGQIPPAQPEVLIRQLCTFIQKEGGIVPSATVVQHFKDRISNQDVALFRQLLKQIAVLQKGSEESHWVLKPEYQEHV